MLLHNTRVIQMRRKNMKNLLAKAALIRAFPQAGECLKCKVLISLDFLKENLISQMRFSAFLAKNRGMLSVISRREYGNWDRGGYISWSSISVSETGIWVRISM